MNADNLFEQQDPPPGGAERFARRLDAAAAAAVVTPGWRSFAWAAAAAAIAAVAVALVMLRGPRDPVAPVASSQPAPKIHDSPEFDRLLGRPLHAEQLTAVVNKQAASVTELESHNEKVRIYEVN